MRYSKTSPPSRIVVRAPNFIGDAVMAMPFFEALKEAFPESHRTLIATHGPSEVLKLPALNSLFSEVWTLDSKKVSAGWQMAGRIRRGKFDLAISLPASTSAALIFFLARVPWRIGWAEPTAAPFYHQALSWKGVASGKHKSDLYLDLLSIPSLRAKQPIERRTRIASAEPRNDYFLVAPGASIALRQWPRLTEFLSLLRKTYPQTKIILVGGSADVHWSSLAASLKDPLIEDQIGHTSLEKVVSLAARAKAVIAMDSGLAHLAASLAHAPTVVVLGPGNPDYILPKASKVIGVRLTNLACSPCESAVCLGPYGYQACLKNLAASAVLDGLQAVLKS